MTDKQYGTYQTPSSRPPEPPYRSGAQGAADATAPSASEGQPASSQTLDGAYRSEPTESFEQARFGTTQEMPRETFAVDPLYQEPARREAALQEPSYQEPARQEPASRETGYREPAGESGAFATRQGASRDSSAARYRASDTARDYASALGAQASGSTHAAAQMAQKPGGAGKAFLFGFLGALLACAIAFGVLGLGGFARASSSTAGSATTTTNLGTSDPSVINAVEEGQTLSEAVAAKALPSVVAVYNYQQPSSAYGIGYGASAKRSASSDGMQASGMGSGVVISEDGYILTNYHVVEDADKIAIKVGDDERDAAYVGGDSSSDIAVIKVDDTEGLEPADIGDSDSLVIGEWVMTVGAPLGLEQSVATGVVSATNRSTIMSDSDSSDLYSYYYGNSTQSYTYYPNMIQTDAVINPGNSGGALVDADGKLIGINTMISSYSGDYAGVGFAIPVNYAIGIAEQIIDGKEPSHALLGVSISSVNASNAKRYGLSSTSGAYIAEIAEGTGAAESDLQVGDIITQIDDSKITSTTDVTLEVREHNPGDTVSVTVNRDGEEMTIEVTLSSDENANSSSGTTAPNGSRDDEDDGGWGRGNTGGSNGYSMEQLEELLKMLGM